MNLTNFKADLDHVPTDLHPFILGVEHAKGIDSTYVVGMWNYCTQNSTVTHCMPAHKKYWFNPIDTFNLTGLSLDKNGHLPARLRDGLKLYHHASDVLYYFWAVALAITVFEIICGVGAVFSRIGSFVTTLCAAVSVAASGVMSYLACLLTRIQLSFIFVLGTAILITIVFPTLTGALKKELEHYDVAISDGTRMLSIIWIAAALSLVSILFWTFSICCCAARSPYGHRGRQVVVEKTPYTYEPLGTQYATPHNIPLTSMAAPPGMGAPTGPAYEPFRHV